MRDGVEIDLVAMGCGIDSIASLLAPLGNAVKCYALNGNKDHTPLPVLAPG
ncbi:hypothetical protein J2785_007223 [Burkholderia ambifaria]|nr:hypothetical protein [Burkholderia ambifaria]